MRLLLLLSSLCFAELKLVAVTDPYCHVCERWHEEVGQQYDVYMQSHNLPELVEVPQDSYSNRMWVYHRIGLLHALPTFIVMNDDEVLGSFEGYTVASEFIEEIEKVIN
jgi:hypothetical protein